MPGVPAKSRDGEQQQILQTPNSKNGLPVASPITLNTTPYFKSKRELASFFYILTFESILFFLQGVPDINLVYIIHILIFFIEKNFFFHSFVMSESISTVILPLPVSS